MIRTAVEVNGSPEKLVMDYEDLLSERSKASGRGDSTRSLTT